jgi:hypothetical protein
MTPEDSYQLELQTPREHIAYLVGLFEAYDHFAVVRTVDSQSGRVELLCSPDYLADIRLLLAHLQSAENIPITIFN